MRFLTSCLSFSLSSCRRRNGRARAHAIRMCRYSNMFEKQNALYHLKKGAECELEMLFSDEKLLFQKDHRHFAHLLLLFRLEGNCSLLSISSILKALEYHPNAVGYLRQF